MLKSSRISAVVNISIDDISSHPLSSDKCLSNCYRLIDLFPDVKISLFIPTAYWRTVDADGSLLKTATEHPLYLNEDKDLCNTLKGLSKKNFEVCYHGFYHGIPGVSNNHEFKELNYEEARDRLYQMMEPVVKAGLINTFKKIIRPPSWYMSAESIRAARDLGFEYISLATDRKIRRSYQFEDKKASNVTYYNICPPYSPYPEEVYLKNNIVFHACEWSDNYFGEDNFKDLVSTLKAWRGDIRFGFTEDMTQAPKRTFMTLKDYRESIIEK